MKFDEHGDGLGRYNIYNFRKVISRDASASGQGLAAVVASAVPNETIGQLEMLGGGSPDAAPIDKFGEVPEASFKQESPMGQMVVEHILTTNSEFEYSTVGRWTESDYNLLLDNIEFSKGAQIVPESFCSKPCELGQAKMVQAGNNCCWICKTCQPYEFLPNENSCQDCGIGRWPVLNKTSCYDLPKKILRWDSAFSLISITISCSGVATTLFIAFIFIKYIDTPVVKASGRELSFILLTGVAFCHMVTFILLAKPTIFVCGGQRFLVSSFIYLAHCALQHKHLFIIETKTFHCGSI